MKTKIIVFSLTFFILNSCISIPKETTVLSKALGQDLVILQESHRRTVALYFNKIKEDINTFVDDIYAPFIIHFVLNKELIKYKQQDTTSLYSVIEKAGHDSGKKATNDVVLIMQEFQEAANKQINSKRKELLDPILQQENEIITVINVSYQNVIHANTTITAYLLSVQKVKETQKKALNSIGINPEKINIAEKLAKLSESINSVVSKGKEIDIKSEKAYENMKNLVNKIKKLTTKTK